MSKNTLLSCIDYLLEHEHDDFHENVLFGEDKKEEHIYWSALIEGEKLGLDWCRSEMNEIIKELSKKRGES